MCPPKIETRIILNILYSCKSIACDILMTLAIKRIHNLPPHLSYVSTLPDITQNQTQHWRAEAEAHWHLGPIDNAY